MCGQVMTHIINYSLTDTLITSSACTKTASDFLFPVGSVHHFGSALQSEKCNHFNVRVFAVILANVYSSHTWSVICRM